MAIIYSNAVDGYIHKSNQSTWANARDASNGTVVQGTSTLDGVSAETWPLRSGGYDFDVSRAFFYFDVSGVSVLPTSATLNIYGRSFTDGDFFAVKSNGFTGGIDAGLGAPTLDGDDFNAIVGWHTGDNTNNVTKYSDLIESWGNGYQTITLTTAALEDMRDDNSLKICLVNAKYDLTDVSPTGHPSNGMYFANYTGTSRDPYIQWSAGWAQEKMNGITSGNIQKINGIERSNIEKVNGV
tara:strand:+ start:191 stop:910 length:720 start_codon:yes stop_codon:yes gene_type:complete